MAITPEEIAAIQQAADALGVKLVGKPVPPLGRESEVTDGEIETGPGANRELVD